MLIEVGGDAAADGAVPISLLWTGARSTSSRTAPDTRPTPLLVHTRAEGTGTSDNTVGLDSSPQTMAQALGQLF